MGRRSPGSVLSSPKYRGPGRATALCYSAELRIVSRHLPPPSRPIQGQADAGGRCRANETDVKGTGGDRRNWRRGTVTCAEVWMKQDLWFSRVVLLRPLGATSVCSRSAISPGNAGVNRYATQRNAPHPTRNAHREQLSLSALAIMRSRTNSWRLRD
jgi:hypothetical protein